MQHGALRFVLVFLLCIGVFSLLLQFDTVTRHAVEPLTRLITRLSSFLLNVAGFQNVASGTTITGEGGFTINILNGCNGVYVTGIVVSAVLAFPSSWKEKALGAILGVVGVHLVNLIRILSLFYIGLRLPGLFERFHYYVWQTGVIIVSMAIWIFWAEVFVKTPTRADHAGKAGAGG